MSAGRGARKGGGGGGKTQGGGGKGGDRGMLSRVPAQWARTCAHYKLGLSLMSPVRNSHSLEMRASSARTVIFF